MGFLYACAGATAETKKLTRAKIIGGLVLAFAVLGQATASADHGGATFEHECASRQGNPDGTWCLWTNPDNGLRYLVTSEYEYRNGLPYYKP